MLMSKEQATESMKSLERKSDDHVWFNLIPEVPFNNHHSARVYMGQRDLRRMVRFSPKTSEKLHATYARYLYQVWYYKVYGCEIPDGYEVDHINDDKLDDRIENFQLLTKQENVIKQNYMRGERKFVYQCIWCGSIRTKCFHELSDKSEFALRVCSKGCGFELAFCKIPQHLRKWISENQRIYSIREFFAYGDSPARIQIEQIHPYGLRGYTILTLATNPNVDTTGLYVSSSEMRIQAIIQKRSSGHNIHEIGRQLGIDYSTIFRQISRWGL